MSLDRHLFNHIPVHLDQELEQITLEDYRYYVTPDGKKYPSITTCLSDYNKKSLDAWRKRVGDEEADRLRDRGANRGTLLHDTIERYILNKPPEPPNPWVHENFLQVQPFLDKYLTDIHGVERRLHSDYLGCSGTSDVIGRWAGVKSIIDWKSSTKEKAEKILETYFIQTTFYSIAFEERTGMQIKQLVIVMIVDDSPVPMVYTEQRKNWVDKCVEVVRAYVDKHPEKFDRGRIYV